MPDPTTADPQSAAAEPAPGRRSAPSAVSTSPSAPGREGSPQAPPPPPGQPAFWGPLAVPPNPMTLLLVGVSGWWAAFTADSQTGLQVTVLAVLIASATLSVMGRRAVADATASSVTLTVVALALATIPFIRGDLLIAALCVLGAIGLAAIVATGGRRWSALVAALPVLALSLARAIPWLCRVAWRRARPASAAAWLRGLVLGVPLVVVVAALLAQADDAFGALLSHLVPSWDSTLMIEVLIGGLGAAVALAFAVARAGRPAWQVIPTWRWRSSAAEWALPLVLLIVVLTAFFAVQASLLFATTPLDLLTGALTAAERARRGFAELVVVTGLVAVALGWAGLRSDPCDERHRSILTGLGGVLVLLSTGLAASALRRLWLYQDAYGWTTLRIEVAAFEIWLALAVVGVGVLRLTRRMAWAPRLVAGMAGVVLLVLALAGPEALVARWNVDRFLATGEVDVAYLATLGPDATPELVRLPEPQRWCVLPATVGPDPWYAVNLSRMHASAVLSAVNGSRSAREVWPTCPDGGG